MGLEKGFTGMWAVVGLSVGLEFYLWKFRGFRTKGFLNLA